MRRATLLCYEETIYRLFLILSLLLSGCTAIDRMNNSNTDEEISNILKNNTGNILHPNDVSNITPTDIQSGQKYFLRYDYFNTKEITSTEYSRMRLVEIDGNALIFDLLKSDLTVKKSRYVKIENGRQFLMSPSKPNEYFELSSSDKACSFKLGRCEYSSSDSDRVEYIEREFENGVWITLAPYIGLGKRTETEIFDKNGLILLRVNQKMEWVLKLQDLSNVA